MLESHAAVYLIPYGVIQISIHEKDLCTSCLHGSGFVSPLGDILSSGASRVFSKSSARRIS